MGVAIVLDVTYPMIECMIHNEIVFKLYGMSIIPYFYLFFAGCFVAEYRIHIIPVLQRFWWFFFLANVLLCLWGRDLPGRYAPIRTVVLLMTVFGMAYRFRVDIAYDISYELYIFHGVILNLLVEVGMVENMIYFYLTILVTVILSIIAHIVQRKIVKRCTDEVVFNSP